MAVLIGEAPISYCNLCGAQITQSSWLLHHARWPAGSSLRVCQACYGQRPRCRACDLPLSGDRAGNLCPTCAASLPRCRACGQPISGMVLEVNGSGPYCGDCARNRPACDICGAPLGAERWQFSDGRVSCSGCHATAVYHAADATALYQALQRTLAERLGLALNIPTGLFLVDLNGLAEAAHMQRRPAHDPQQPLGVYVRQGLRRGIYVQNGLPRALLLHVTAHELAHAWQSENCPLLDEPLVLEGFAEWTAYKTLGFYGFGALQRMPVRQDIYGQGLRWALQLEADLGENAVIEACRSAVVQKGVTRI